MKRTVLAIALILGAVCANAQETTSTGDLYQGLTDVQFSDSTFRRDF